MKADGYVYAWMQKLMQSANAVRVEGHPFVPPLRASTAMQSANAVRVEGWSPQRLSAIRPGCNLRTRCELKVERAYHARVDPVMQSANAMRVEGTFSIELPRFTPISNTNNPKRNLSRGSFSLPRRATQKIPQNPLTNLPFCAIIVH